VKQRGIADRGRGRLDPLATAVRIDPASHGLQKLPGILVVALPHQCRTLASQPIGRIGRQRVVGGDDTSGWACAQRTGHPLRAVRVVGGIAPGN